MKETKVCPVCGHNLMLGYKKNGLVFFNISKQNPANVLCCENCWYDQPWPDEPDKNLNDD